MIKKSIRDIVLNPPFILDRVRNAAAAYSLRKLRTAYQGSCIKVRRSSDDAEMDIGFTGNVLDTTTLLSFCGGGSGFVTTWYEQSGNDRDVTQSVTTSQPRIVNNGTLDVVNGKPCLVVGTGATLYGKSVPMTANQEVTMFCVGRNTGFNTAIFYNGNPGTNGFGFFDDSASAKAISGGITYYNNATTIRNAVAILTLMASQGRVPILRFNGLSLSLSSSYSSNGVPDGFINTVFGSDSIIQESIFYLFQMQTLTATVLENDQSLYYGIVVI